MVGETRARKWSACTRPVRYIYARCLKTFPLPSSFMCVIDKQTIEHQFTGCSAKETDTMSVCNGDCVWDVKRCWKLCVSFC